MQIILTPFSWLLTAFYNLGHSYALALVLFAIVVKLILFPFSLKGKRGMIQMNLLNGKIQKIQKQYANNKVKANEEIQKLYAQEKVNPMSGCLWSFIPVLVLWPLYAIIRRPFYYMMGQTDATIQAISEALNFTASGSSAYNELKMAGMVTANNLQMVKDAANGVTQGLGDKIFHINFNFLGLDLSQIATWKLWETDMTWAAIGLFLLPVISAALGLVMSWVSQKTNVMNKQQNGNPAAKQMRTMMVISPLISLWIGFVMPAGLCIYWIINNVLQIASELISGKILKKDYEKAAAARAEQERLEKEEEKRKKQLIAERRAKAMEEAKKNKGKKKATPKPEKKKPSTNDAGRIGMRPYARGRCYDPDRYGGVTPYHDPDAVVDEEAVEAARQAREEAEAAARMEEEIEREVERELAGEQVEETTEVAETEEITEDSEAADTVDTEEPVNPNEEDAADTEEEEEPEEDEEEDEDEE